MTQANIKNLLIARRLKEENPDITYREIGEILGISRQRVQQILARGFPIKQYKSTYKIKVKNPHK